MAGRVATTLVTGASASARESAIAALLAAAPPVPGPGHRSGLSAVILEGLAAGNSPIQEDSSVRLVRLASGCPCCAGNLVLRVTLNRLLRQGPERLFIGLANGEHLDQLRSWLQDSPYDQLLALEPVVALEIGPASPTS